ncbi:MAG TPA: hypothetical protein VMO26_00900 [Vicinamibacterales bacterium]|nr:hypothetical protein [Vicinamibacterales bacterium]
MARRLAQLSGTRVNGALQLTEPALNELIGLATPGGTVPTVQLLDANRIEVRYGVVHARAKLPPALDAGSAPRMTVTLASTVMAWALRATLGQPFVEFHGRHVTIHLAAVPALAPWRALWPHVKSAQFSTVPGVLRVQVGVSIENGVDT